MHATAPTPRPLVRLRPISAAAFTLCLSFYLGLLLFGMTRHGLEGGPKIDFDIFYLVGKMVWAGTLPDAYTLDLFTARQIELVGGKAWAPWTYPPQFDAVAAGLALLSHGQALVVFALGTLAAYLLVLRRLAGEHFAAVALTMMPILLGSVAIGQNGLLTGTLAGAFALLALRRRPLAGVPLGLMVIKPHLAVGLGLAVLLTRRWAVLAWAVAVVAGTSLLCTLAFGAAVWPAFLHGVAESKEFMVQGDYLLGRMCSIYAALRTLGVGAGAAGAAQLVVALAGLSVVGLATLRRWAPRRLLAAAALSSLIVSPYLQHYDLVLLGIGLALATPDLAAPASRRLYPLVFASVWLIAALVSGYSEGPLSWLQARLGGVADADRTWSLSGFVLVVLVAFVLAILRRAEQGPSTAPGEPPAP